MRRARLWLMVVVALSLVLATGCAEKETNPFDPSQDPDAPVVTDFSYSDGVATWTTDEPALCVLEYAPTDGEYRNYVYESTKTHSESHRVTLLGMEDGQTYQFRIRSLDRAGNEDYRTNVALPDDALGTAFTDLTMRLSVIDVGWGLSMVLETPGGAHVMIDSGADHHLDDVEGFLYDHDITYLDYAIISHYHADHYGGYAEDGGILDSFWVGEFIAPDTTHALMSMPTSLREKLDARNIDVNYAYEGDDSWNRSLFNWDDTPGFFVRVLSAGIGTQFITDPDMLPEDVEGNNDSIVMRVTFGDVSFLPSADAEFFVEHHIVNTFGRAAVRADVLQAGHHGNDDATSEFWLDNVDPRIGLISNAIIEAPLTKEVVLQNLRAVDADYFATDRIIPNTPRDADPHYGHLIAVTDGESIEVMTEDHEW